MATALQSFRLTVRSCQCRPHAQRSLRCSTVRQKAFTTTRLLCEDSKSPSTESQSDGQETEGDGEGSLFGSKDFWKRRDEINALPDSDPTKIYKKMQERQRIQEIAGFDEDVEIEPTRREFMGERGFYFPPEEVRKKLKNTYLNMGEEVPFEDDDFEVESELQEEMNSLAHGELEQHREMRHYARLAAWEMPLLSKYAKPFEPPTLLQPLRFRYTSYLGEQHPAEKKVVLEFCAQDMPDLTILQKSKLIKLAGVRYNPETDVIKMSCEMFASQAQNKRYLGDKVQDMLREARDPTDTFEDVPFDLRHHKFKPKPTFPESWKMTALRREELAKARALSELSDQRRLLGGQLVDGIKQIEQAFKNVAGQPTAVSEMAMAGKGAKGKGKKVAVKR